MQSHLAAALLGQNTPSNATEDDEKDDHDAEEPDDVDEFIDEEDAESAKSAGGKSGPANAATSRTVTLQMLLSADILQPGNGTMSIEYLGQRFIGDLLPDGKIKSQETDIIFASPSAWAIHCKRIINPDKKSGCGWASVKYKGKKLDAYKNIWYKKKKQEELQDKIEEQSDNEVEIENVDSKIMAAPQVPIQRIVVKHNTIANRTFTHDANTLIECVPFSNLGKIQPFLISMSTNAVLVMDFHCHLMQSEVSGYLAGQWDVNGHSKNKPLHLTITHCFPCRCSKLDREHAPQVELEVQKQIELHNLILVGWYHSHPTSPAAPTLRDVDSQLDYQIRMKGSSDSNYTPCIGVICSPYNPEYSSLESAIICYWVIPPPETKPNEYGRPMLMSYSVVQDNYLSQIAMEEMRKCGSYYRNEKKYVNFLEKYQNNTTYLEKLKATLTSKFPRDQSDGIMWGFIKEILGFSGDEKIDTSALLQVPNPLVKHPQVSLSNLSTATSLSSSNLTSNLMLTSNLANVLFSSGKFPSPSSLLGLPDPMAQSTLAANNMFLSPSLFKMQDTLNLLKPLSTSSPIPSTSKADPNKQKKSDLKTSTLDFTNDLNLLTLKNKLDFGIPELNLPKSNFNAADLSISSVRPTKIDFSASDLSISSAKSKSTDSYGLDATIKNFMTQSMLEPPPAKIPKTDYSMLDLSLSSGKSLSLTDSLSYSGISDFTAPSAQQSTSKNESATSSEQPLNLAE